MEISPEELVKLMDQAYQRGVEDGWNLQLKENQAGPLANHSEKRTATGRVPPTTK